MREKLPSDILKSIAKLTSSTGENERIKEFLEPLNYGEFGNLIEWYYDFWKFPLWIIGEIAQHQRERGKKARFVGEIKLQRVSYFLKNYKFKNLMEFIYESMPFGPYSEDLTKAMDMLVENRYVMMIKHPKDPSNKDQSIYEYELMRKGKDLFLEIDKDMEDRLGLTGKTYNEDILKYIYYTDIDTLNDSAKMHFISEVWEPHIYYYLNKIKEIDDIPPSPPGRMVGSPIHGINIPELPQYKKELIERFLEPFNYGEFGDPIKWYYDFWKFPIWVIGNIISYKKERQEKDRFTGAVRLQLIVYFIVNYKFKNLTEFIYEPMPFGPYSEDLTKAIDMLVENRYVMMIKHPKDPSNKDQSIYEYKLMKKGKDLFLDIDKNMEDRLGLIGKTYNEDILKYIYYTDIDTLSDSAKIHFISKVLETQLGNTPNKKEKIADMHLLPHEKVVGSLTHEEIDTALKQLNELDSVRPDVVTLAMLASLARRIEPEVLRALRLTLGDLFAENFRPTVATEAALWFSPFIESRGPDNITLLPEFRQLLLERLRANKELFDASFSVIRKCHNLISPILHWEEDLVYLSLIEAIPDPKRKRIMDKKTWHVIRAISTNERPGLEEWIAEMGIRFPKAANLNPLFAQLISVSREKTILRSKSPVAPTGSENLGKLDFPNMPTVFLDVSKVGGMFRIGYLLDTGEFRIRVPDIQPISIDVLQADSVGTANSLVILPGEFVDIPIPAQISDIPRHTNQIRIRAIDGHVYSLDSHLFDDISKQKEIDESFRNKHILQPDKVLRGHNGQVRGIAITLDGRQVISGSYDNTLRIWDLLSGKALRTLYGHTDRVFGVALMPNNQLAVSCSADRSIRLWDLNSGYCTAIFEGHTRGVCSVAVTPDGQWIISGSFDKTLRIWDLKTTYCIAILQGHTDSIFSVAVTPDGRYVVSASGDRTLRIWDLETAQCVATLEGHSGPVDCVVITPDGRSIISGSRDYTVRVWDLESGRELAILEGHSDAIIGLAVTSDNHRVFTSSLDKTVRIWDLPNMTCIESIGLTKYLLSIAVMPDCHQAIFGSNDNAVWVWDLPVGSSTHALDSAFLEAPDKDQTWKDLIRLTQDKNRDVQFIAAEALGSAFSQVSDKDQAWKDLHGLTQDKDRDLRSRAAGAIGSAFSQIPDKDQAWKDLHGLTQDVDRDIRWRAAGAIGSAFSQIPDKDQAWKDLHGLTQDVDRDIRWRAAGAIGSAFSYVNDKDRAWKDLIRLTQDKNRDVQFIAAEALGSAFSQVSDKDQAWKDLHRLTQDKDRDLRSRAAGAIGSAFSQIPDKDQAWKDLHGLTQDVDRDIRWRAAGAIGSAFSQIPDKDQAWKDLHRLIQDKERDVRLRAADAALSLAFSQIPDKDQAWKDLVRLTQHEDKIVRLRAVDILSSAFPEIPNKGQAWKDLHRLTQHKDSEIRWRAAETLGSALSYIPDKNQAQVDLIKLTQDENSYVRMYAYHSLGKSSVYNAALSESIEALREHMDKALDYFERSVQESKYSPATFCLPFYRSYSAITFQDAREEEVKRYLEDAKKAIGDSESKVELIKAVENLAGALQESQRLKSRSVEEIAYELNAYRWYCDQAANYITAVEKSAPGTAKLIRKAIPILEGKIEVTIAEIQKSAKRICQVTQRSGSKYEVPSFEIHRAAEALSSDNLASIQISSSAIVIQLRKFCRHLPEDKKDIVRKVLEEIERMPEFPEKLQKIEIALMYLSSLFKNESPSLVDIVILTVLPEEYNRICSQISELHPPSDIRSIPNLISWQLGNVFCQKFDAAYRIAIGMIGRAGSVQSALAAIEAVQLWRPRYILFSGIANGLYDRSEMGIHPMLGDVIIADTINSFEYGEIDRKFKPHEKWIYRTDQELLNSAKAYALSDSWKEHIKAASPTKCNPKVISGEIASVDKVVDNPSDEFFARVTEMWPKVKAVEMEGIGIGSTIEQIQSLGIPIGFMMIGGISDLSHTEVEGKRARERIDWAIYASDVVASFLMAWIANGLPIRPATKNSITL